MIKSSVNNTVKFFNHSKSKNYIFTVAVGAKYFNDWKKFAKNNWIEYCKNNSIGLAVIYRDIISKDDKLWKKPQWQKFLIGQYVIDNNLKIENICYLDSDILINPNSENIFKFNKKNKISLVSQINNLPYRDLNYVRRKIAFNRHHFLSNRYPLDSALFMNLKQIYKFHKKKPQADFACMGLFMFNVNSFYKIMKKWFDSYDKKVQSLSGGGEEPLLNYEILKHGKVNWLSYKFQALWTYEIAFKYSFLYKNLKNKKLIKLCIEDSLNDNYFLHFAGSWNETDIWKSQNLFYEKKTKKLNNEFFKYLKQKITGRPKGRILPKTK